MLPTPTTDSVDYDLVYEPAEDSFLLLDLLEEQKEFLDTHFQTTQNGDKPHVVAGEVPLVLEIGTGSGIVTTFMHKNIIKQGLFLTTDLNLHACQASLTTSRENGGTPYLDTIRASLSSALRRRLVDVLIFNPPYVPNEQVPSRPDDDNSSSWLDLALEGGEDGMEVTNVLLDGLDSVLSDRGIAYILFCKRNNPEKVAESMAQRGWKTFCVGERRAGWEVLSVWRFMK
ncbi:Mtq2p [Sugiyamaella lignohabitans]|uniref:Mtq2p n=1 Tax=Sugiyamaella lignohabitans TaxID=796027 RepID=A0A161HH45_9ASCO|nr:Mtq2p [Sugiyamaella lignohabitans]ANB11317.1 Mtq2p [Sugiyamaella lignohabitans]